MRFLIAFVLCLTIAGAALAQYPGVKAGTFGGGQAGPTISQAEDEKAGPPVAGVTVTIPKMPIKDALAKVEPGWEFEGELGDRTMPGAKFINFPSDMAAAMLLASAGLAPPDQGKTVTELLDGRFVNMTSLFKWNPVNNTAVYVTDEDSRVPKISERRFSANSHTLNIPWRPTVMAIGGYEQETKQGSQMVYTVLTSQVSEEQFFELLFNTAGVKYKMGDLALPRRRSFPPHPIIASYQVYDQTLEQSLAEIARSNLLSYQKTGPEDDPTYVVEVSSPKNQ